MYDVLIIGAGPAGLTAGLYAARAKMSTLILEKDKGGGQIAITDEVANYPGAVEGETGPTLVEKMIAQVDSFGAERKRETVVSLDVAGKVKKVTCESGTTYEAKSIILATGASPRKLGIPGEKELSGKGVSYCATCDGDFFTDLEIYCFGGGDTALEEAMFLTKFGKKVYLVHRRDEFRAAKSIVAKVEKHPKIEIILDTIPVEFKGEGILESIVLKNKVTGEEKEVHADEEDGTFGAFVFVGYIPQSEIFKDVVELNDSGYIVTNELMHTNVEGVFAAGDIREKVLRQVVTATADGAIAATQAEKYIEEHFED